MAATRLEALRARMRSEGADAIALTHVPNIAYCTDFRGVFDAAPDHIALVADGVAMLLTDGRYIEALTQASENTEWRVQLARDSLASALTALLGELGVARCALETSMPYARFSAFRDAIAAAVVEASGWVEDLRAVKDASEIAAIAAAQELTDRAFEHLLGVLRVGASELDIALELEFFMRREGSEGVAFPPIVASGPNSALPHAKPSSRELATGDLVVLDFGAIVDGYCADMTRTVVIGSAAERHRAVYETVAAANSAALRAVRAGLRGQELDAVARGVIASAGFGEFFGHGLGHGVGREVHERPGLGPRSEGEIVAGNVVTIEPGVYIPGFGGVRIEDLVVVEEGGANVLTRSTKDLLEL